jgi:prolyl-tRNA synthetase
MNTKMRDSKAVTPMSEDFDRWYVDVIRRAELADYTPVRGCMVIRPYGFALWENIQSALDAMIKRTGHENMYFPLLIPESFLTKEADHVEGFAPEVMWVTHGGSKELEERLAIRPTSETVICSLYADWIHSYRDLPVLVNQWCNVMRNEKRTRLFLRTAEFLWQEGHTFHETDAQAAAEVEQMLECYRELAEEWLAIPVVTGRKTESEKFAGARYTLSIEGMMADGWALQMGTSHHLGQNFTKAYDIKYTDRENTLQYPFQTSWGVSTRTVGGLIMAHGDDQGLVMPPRVAPVQAVIIPIARSNDEEGAAAVAAACDRIQKEAGNVRVRIDTREGIRPGEKYAAWELKGAPLRITVGARDLAENSVSVTRRVDGLETKFTLDELVAKLPQLVDDAHTATYARALQRRQERSVDVTSIAELKEAFSERPVFATAPFCNRTECEASVTEAVHALTIRNLRSVPEMKGKPCLACGEPADEAALLARSY